MSIHRSPLAVAASLFAVAMLGVSASPASALTSLSIAPTEDAVIASGLGDRNLDFRIFNPRPFSMIMNNLDSDESKGAPLFCGNEDDGPAACDYVTSAEAGASEEYFIFKFDFSAIPAGNTIVSDGSLDLFQWFTNEEGSNTVDTSGDFRLYEITDGDANWVSFGDPDAPNPNPVTFDSLGGTFVELPDVVEVEVIDEETGPTNELFPGKLVMNGDFAAKNTFDGIPAATLNRLASGESVGLAMKGTDLSGFAIHTIRTFDSAFQPLLTFDFDVDTGGVPGDANGDGSVDLLDLDILGQQFGSSGGDLAADFNADGTVDLLDLDILGQNFGQSGSAVPEPTGAALLAGLVGLAAAARRRR